MTTPTAAVISGCTAWDTAAHEDLEALDRARTEQWGREHRQSEGTATGADERTVQVPARDDHEGRATITLTLPWVCPSCGGPRGEPKRVLSYDGSRRLACDGWTNPCGYIDAYDAVRLEAEEYRAQALRAHGL